jgi:hypothetical protein
MFTNHQLSQSVSKFVIVEADAAAPVHMGWISVSEICLITKGAHVEHL